jgi:resuscitation-promoting factor RpfA
MNKTSHLHIITALCLLLFTGTPRIARGQAMTTNPNMPSKVSIIVLGVTNLSTSVEFYRGKLGLPIANQTANSAMVSASSVTLMLSENLGRAVKPATSSIEIVFPVESVSTAHGLLTQKGCEFTVLPREVSPGSFAATLKDPDGHMLTLFGGK